MNVTVGLLAPRTGAVELFGAPVTRVAPEDIAARGVALVPQGRRIFKSLTVRENLIVAARRGPLPTLPRMRGRVGRGRADGPTNRGADWTLDSIFGMFPRLGERPRQMAAPLFRGEQQMLASGRAPAGNPRAGLMDEPSQGRAPQNVPQMQATLRKLKEIGPPI